MTGFTNREQLLSKMRNGEHLDWDIIVIGGSIGMAKGYTQLVKKYLSNEPKLFQTKIYRSSLGVNSAKIGILL